MANLLTRPTLLWFLMLLPIVGCGRGEHFERLPVVPVEGEVRFQGKPIPGALVVFHPTGSAEKLPPPARGTVREDGAFSLTTYDANDGVVPGEYKVTVEWRKLVDRGGEVKAGPNQLPAKYSRVNTTDLTVQVAAGESRLSTLELKRK